MPKSYKLPIPAEALMRFRDARFVARLVVGTLLLANLVAAYFVWRPLGGSAEELNQELNLVQSQIRQKNARLREMRQIVTKVNTARMQGDSFTMQYFMNRQTAYSTIVSELLEDAKQAGIKSSRATTFNQEPVEGSENLSILSVQADFDCEYAQLIKMLERLDKSDRFIIIESLTAQPRQTAGIITVTMKASTFIREEVAPR